MRLQRTSTLLAAVTYSGEMDDAVLAGDRNQSGSANRRPISAKQFLRVRPHAGPDG